MCAERPGEPRDLLPPAAVATYDRFVALLREGDLAAARELAPGVEITEEGWPYEDETGPLNPHAFRIDPAYDRVLYVEETAPGRYELQSAIAYFELEQANDEYRIVRGGLKPIE
jgi:hypothetical protein